MSEHEGHKPDNRLHAIAGRWQTSGHVIDEPEIPAAGTDTYEVLPGGYFLVHHVDVMVGDKPVRAIEIIGEPDAGSGGFLARSFDNDGNAELMRVPWVATSHRQRSKRSRSSVFARSLAVRRLSESFDRSEPLVPLSGDSREPLRGSVEPFRPDGVADLTS
jgi:hypothetical protein